MNGLTFKINSSEIHPVTPYSHFLLDNFPITLNLDVLDFGTGTGVLTIAASLLGANKVYSVDIDREAIALAEDNVDANNIPNVRFALDCTTLDKLIPQKSIDVIVSNPASLPSENRLVNFLDSGPLGNKMIFELIKHSNLYLKPTGKLYFIHTSLVPQALTKKHLVEYGFSYEIIAEKTIPFRRFYYPHLSHFNYLTNTYDSFFKEINGEYYETLYLYSATFT